MLARLLELEGAWLWLSAAAVLAIAEMIAPGVYLIWLGLAALITGVIGLAFPIGIGLQVIIFAVMATLSIGLARRFGLASRLASPEADRINNRASQMIGRVAIVTEAIGPGRGRVKLGDSEWSADGPAAQIGEAVVITSVQSSVLIVQPQPSGAPRNDGGNREPLG